MSPLTEWAQCHSHGVTSLFTLWLAPASEIPPRSPPWLAWPHYPVLSLWCSAPPLTARMQAFTPLHRLVAFTTMSFLPHPLCQQNEQPRCFHRLACPLGNLSSAQQQKWLLFILVTMPGLTHVYIPTQLAHLFLPLNWKLLKIGTLLCASLGLCACAPWGLAPGRCSVEVQRINLCGLFRHGSSLFSSLQSRKLKKAFQKHVSTAAAWLNLFTFHRRPSFYFSRAHIWQHEFTCKVEYLHSEWQN